MIGAQQRRAGALSRLAGREDDRGRVRGGEMVAILRIGDECQIAGLRVLDAGDATNLDLAVAVQPTVQPFS